MKKKKEEICNLFALHNINVDNASSFGEDEDEIESYLKKEEKVLSLLRTKKEKKWQSSSVMEAISSTRFFKSLQGGEDAAMLYLITALSKVVAEKISLGNDAVRKLFSGFADVVKVAKLAFCDKKLLNATKTKDARLPERMLNDAKEEDIGIAVSLPLINRIGCNTDVSHLLVDPRGKVRSSHNGAGSKMILDQEYRYCCNPDVFSILALISYMRERVQRDIAEKGEESILFQKLQVLQQKEIDRIRKNGNLFIHNEVCRPFILRYLNDNGITFQKKEFDLKRPEAVLQEIHFLPAFLLEKELKKEDYAFSLVTACLFNDNKLKKKKILSLCGFSWTDESSHIITEIMKELVADYQMQKKQEEYENSLAKEYASVWETKKNIPRKVLKAMKASHFNDTFGFVEFDEECDLKKVAELEKEWEAIVRLLGIGKYKDVSLRFRKLGNHKAAGLYFPSLCCLCVDVRYPSSMIHEVFHMMDYHEGRRSEKNSFYGIRKRYEMILRQEIEKLEPNDPVKKQMNGKSKYNLSYYLTPTEIFARCGEMYLLKRGVDNSLLKPEDGIAYPKDEVLMNMITQYFDAMLERGNVA